MSIFRQTIPAYADFPAAVGLGEQGDGELLSGKQKDELMARIYERGDRLVSGFICVHTLIALILAPFYQTWLVTGVVTFCAVAMFMVAVKLVPRSFTTRCTAGISLQTFVALHIYQLHGLAEMHFLFFTAFTVLIVYQDWKCMWPGAIGLIGQHTGFALLHNAGVGAAVFFFEEGYVGFTKLFFHFAIALSQVVICGYWAFLIRRQTLASAAQNAGLRAMGEQLHQSEGKFRTLIAQALDIITIVDAEGTILYESPAVERVLGYRPEELMGRNIFELVHPGDRAAVIAAFAHRHAANERGATPAEFRYRHQDGTWRILQAVGSGADASVGGMVINSRDVTERRQAEEAMRLAKEEAEQANVAKSEFLSRMSHELRTPLNAILGFGQILEISDLEKRSVESVGHIMRGGRHLLSLIDEVLAISRIEARRLCVSLEPVALAPIASECLSLISRQAEDRGVRCENLCRTMDGVDRYVLADLQRLRQVLLNLLSNAVKYNRSGGVITLSCREVSVAASAPSEASHGSRAEADVMRRLRLEVSDTGYGLTAEEISRLFTPFERLQAERSTIEGTGLGLALSKGLVEAMGGVIGVDSVPGTGSTFWLELPLAVDAALHLGIHPAKVVMSEFNRQYAGTVLYIEDNLSNLRLIELLLEDRVNFELLSSQQGTLGIELAQSRQPDLILLDLHLPDLPGWEVLARLQADERTRHIPVVVISADATPGQIARLLGKGAREYLTKPIEVTKLMQVLNQYLPIQTETALSLV